MKFLFIGLLSLILTAVSINTYALVTITNTDGPDEGFNDPTAVSPVGGNTGTTLGEQRLNVFNKAAEILSAQFNISVPMIINANFNPIACTPYDGILGQAGPIDAIIDEASRSIIPVPLYNQQVGYDVRAELADIQATFNSSVDNNDNCLTDANWYYGFDTPNNDDYSLLSIFIHELIHGMGLVSYMRENGLTNFKFEDGNDALSIFTHNLKSVEDDELLSNLPWYSRGQAFLSETGLVWAGEKVNSLASGYDEGLTNGQVQMYAPSEYSDSSVSHFSTNLSPNEVMEPFYTDFFDGFGLATQALGDIGWTIINENSAPQLNTTTDVTLNEDDSIVILLIATDDDGDEITFSIASSTEEIGASLDGKTLTLAPAYNFNGSGTVTINITDGEAKIRETINVLVVPVNDAPLISAIPDVEFDINSTSESTIIATDVDDTPQVTVTTSAPSVVSASLIDMNLTLAPASIYNGSAIITMTASDGQANVTTSFTATVTGGATPPPLELNIDDINVDNNSIYPADDLENITLSLRGGDSDYSASVLFNGEYRTDLLTNESGNLILKLPETGAFAGNYELIIDDGNNLTSPIAITIQRPLRIVANTNPTIANTSTAEIKFEGAPAGDTITLVDSEISFIDKTGTSISTLTASNDPDNFNQVSTYLDAKDPGSYEITATLLNAPDANKNISVVLTRTLDLSIRDKFNAAVPNTNISIEDDRLAGWNLLKNHQTNQLGLLTLTLPRTSLDIKVAADGFNSQVIQVTDSEASRNVELVLSDGYYRLKGTVASSGFDFGDEAPEVMIELSSGNNTSPDTTTFNNGELTFSWMSETEIASPQTLSITHSGAAAQTIALDVSLGTEEIEAQLLPVEVVAAPDNGDTGSGDGSGSSGGGNASWLLLTAIALLRRKRVARNKA